MLRLTKIPLCCLLMLAPGVAQDKSKNQNESAGKQATKTTQPKDDGHVVPDAIGFKQQGLLDDRGNSVVGGDGKMTALQVGREDAARGEVDPTAGDNEPMRGDHLFKPTVYLRPRRLAPGEVGELHVVVTLGAGGNVVVPGSVAELRIAPSNAFGIGAVELDPASMARHAKQYRGRTIYEDTLRFQAPITIAAGVALGHHAVEGSVRLFLHDANSGDPQGLFVAKVAGRVEVGAPLPPGGAGGSSASGTGTTTPSETATSAAKNSEGKNDELAQTSARGESGVVPAQADGEGSSGSRKTAPLEAPHGWSTLVFIVGPVLALALALLIFRRR